VRTGIPSFVVQFVIARWDFFALLLFWAAEKVVRLTPWKWDDLTIDFIRWIIAKWRRHEGRNSTDKNASRCRHSVHEDQEQKDGA